MTAQVVEASSIAKSGRPEFNEDALVLSDSVVAVFDGETDKSGSSLRPSAGRLAARTLAEAGREISDTDTPAVATKRLHEALTDLDSAYFELVAVGAFLHLRTRRIVRVGDVAVGINARPQLPSKQIDVIAAKARAALLESRLRAGHNLDDLRATDPGREMILPLLRAARQWRNVAGSTYGFAAIDGCGTPDSLIEVFDAPRGSEVILATDGYPAAGRTLEQSEAALAVTVRSDPLRIADPPGTKAVQPGHFSFDDRTYVRLKL